MRWIGLLVFLLLNGSSGSEENPKRFAQYFLFADKYEFPQPDRGGTGFYVRYKQQIYLVSAWHLFTWRHPITMAKMGAPPIIIFSSPFGERKLSYPLFLNGEQLFFEPDHNGYFYDIAILPIPHAAGPVIDINEESLSDTVKLNDTVFFFGFCPDSSGYVRRMPVKYEAKIYQLAREDATWHIGKGGSFPGCSGSPVFKKSRSGFTLVGLLSGGGKDSVGKDTVGIVPLKNAWPSFRLK